MVSIPDEWSREISARQDLRSSEAGGRAGEQFYWGSYPTEQAEYEAFGRLRPAARQAHGSRRTRVVPFSMVWQTASTWGHDPPGTTTACSSVKRRGRLNIRTASSIGQRHEQSAVLQGDRVAANLSRLALRGQRVAGFGHKVLENMAGAGHVEHKGVVRDHWNCPTYRTTRRARTSTTRSSVIC